MIYSKRNTEGTKVKKAIIITSIALVLAGTAGASAYVLNQKEPEMKQVEAVKEPVIEPANEVAKEPIAEPIVAQNAPEPVVETVPSNEALIIQYGWITDPFKTAINAIMGMVPQYFTEDERVASFAYLNEVCSKLGPNISYCSTIMISTKDKAATWLILGKKAGVDTSRYE